MKILGMVIGFCLLTSFAFAAVTGQVVKVDLDDKGNIRVWTCYKIDGVEVESLYPKIDGQFVYCSRYNNAPKTQKEIKIDYNAQANQAFITTMPKIVGNKITETEKVIILDTDNDTELDKEITLKADGTKTEKPYTYIPIP